MFRTGLRSVADAALTDAADEREWSLRICEAATPVFHAVTGLALQFISYGPDGFDVDFHRRFHGIGTLVLPHRLALMEQMHANESNESLSDIYLRRSARLVPAGPHWSRLMGPLTGGGAGDDYRPGQRVVLAFELEGRWSLSAHDMRVLTRFARQLAMGAAYIGSVDREAVFGIDGELLEGDGTALWSDLCSGRKRMQRQRGAGQVTFRVVNTPVGLRAARRLSRLETEVLERSARGSSGKQQAFELGVSDAAVSAALSRGAQAMGFAVTHDAVRFLSGLLRASPPNVVALSSAEREVLGLLREGLSNRDIADRRGRSERTVANQVASLLRKTGAPSRRALLSLAP